MHKNSPSHFGASEPVFGQTIELDNLRVQPTWAALGDVGLQQNARLEDCSRRRLTLGDQRIQPFALRCAEFDDEFLGCHDRFALPVGPDTARSVFVAKAHESY